MSGPFASLYLLDDECYAHFLYDNRKPFSLGSIAEFKSHHAQTPPIAIEEWQALSAAVGRAVQRGVRLHLAGRRLMNADEEHRWLSLTADLGRQLSECAAAQNASVTGTARSLEQ